MRTATAMAAGMALVLWGPTPLRERPAEPVHAGLAAAAPVRAALTPPELTAVVQKYCVACHNDQLLTGNLSLQTFAVESAPSRAADAEKIGDLSVDQMITGLRRSARPHVQSPWLAACSMDNSSSCLCTTATCGAGILDAEQAMFYARDPASYVAPAGHAEVLDNAELAAADVTPQASPHPALEAEADTGGGAMGGPWLLLLALAVCALKPGVSWRPRRA